MTFENKLRAPDKPQLVFTFRPVSRFEMKPFAGENKKAVKKNTPVIAAMAPEIETFSHVAK